MKRIFPILGLAVLFSAALITLAITGETDVSKDPVCGMEVNPVETAFHLDTEKGTVYFCSQYCLEKFQANPAAYIAPAVDAKKAEKTSAAEGCRGHEGHAASSAERHSHSAASDCEGKCGQTKIQAVNDFHKKMAPLEECLQKGDFDVLKSAVADLISAKEAILKAECPAGVQKEAFDAARAEFGGKVDALAAAAETGDKEALAKAFQEMHSAYAALDASAR